MNRLSALVLVGAFCALMLAFAQDAAGLTLTVREDSEWGLYLADSEGLSLYSYLEDEGGESACTDEDCVRNWPPYTVSGEVSSADGVAPGLVATYERPDGSTQVTYNGWPLYYNARDESPGDIRGQALGDVFYLMSPDGNRIDVRFQQEPPDTEEAEQQGQEQAEEGEGDAAEADGEGAAEQPEGEQPDGEQPEGEQPEGEQPEGEQPEGEQPEGEGQGDAGGAEMAALMSQGQGIFASICQSCHGAEGQGLVGPNLNGNRYLERAEGVINTILDGRPDHGMPPFANQFDDQEIAAVATYIRNAWDNDFGPVTPEQVAELR